MKKLLVITALLITALSVKAQHEEGDFTIQPRVGVTYSNITDGDKWKLNVTYGVEFEHFLTDQFSLAGGVLFTDQGYKSDVYSDINQVSDETIKMNIYYGALPITANYYVLPGLALKAGIQPAFRVKANIVQGSEKLDFDNALHAFFGDEVKMNKFDFSIPVGFSYELMGVTLDARYNFGLTKIMSGNSENIKNKVFVITLGYKFGK